MRITSETMVTRSLNRLQTRLQAYERSQSELGTGKKILKASDDPTGTRRAMSLKNSLASHERNLKNISDASGHLAATDSQLQTAIERLSRARELANRGASNTNQGEREALALEIDQIAEELRGIANATHQDRPLFAGYTEGPAVSDADPDDPNAPVPGPDAPYFQGEGDQVMRRISDSEKVRINTTAQEWMTYDGGEENVLDELGGLADALRNGGPGDVAPHLDGLKAASDKIADTLAGIGSITNRVESARARAEDQKLTVRTELSEVEDVDVAEGVMEMQIQQVGYEATLQALGQSLPPSLVAFLR